MIRELLKKWLRVDIDIDNAVRVAVSAAVSAKDAELAAKDAELAELKKQMDRMKQDAAASLKQQSEMQQIATEMKRKVGRPTKEHVAFNTSLKPELKKIIALLEHSKIIRRGDVSNYINEKLSEWLYPLVESFFPKGEEE